jgi:glycopeptide antibiotics resistance protein
MMGMRKRVEAWWWVLALWLAGWAYIGFPASLAESPRRVMEWLPTTARPRDILLNFAYYVVFGVVTNRLQLKLPVILLAAAALSVTTEMTQLYSTNRYPSVTDLIANCFGALGGALLADTTHRVAKRE